MLGEMEGKNWMSMIPNDDSRKECMLAFEKCLTSGGQFPVTCSDTEGRRWLVLLSRIPMSTIVIGLFKRMPQNAVQLTPRENEALIALGEDLTNDEISKRLGISGSNLSNVLKKLREKLGVRTNYGLVRYSLALKMFDGKFTLPD